MMGGTFDPSRIAAAIVIGIGFLGAGIIIFRDSHIEGLTTAATLWATAAIGMSIGCGLYTLSLIVTFIIIAILIIIKKIKIEKIKKE